MLGTEGFLLNLRRCTIGIKAFLIESERGSGCDRFAASIRVTQRREIGNPAERGDCEEGAHSGVSGHSSPAGVADWGSCALGLSELEMLGFEPAESEGCVYSPYVCAGFSARLQRDARGASK